MSNWQLTAGLQNLRNQVNAAFPHRDHTSDGTIGDTAHQAETSGHNPDDTSGSRPEWDGDPDSTPEVRAWDMDSDLGSGVTAQQLVDHLRALPGLSSVIRYMIYNRRMYHERDGFAPTPYTGSSPHTEHVHFSGAWSQSADNNTSFNFHLEDLVALTPDDIAAVAQAVWTYQLEDPSSTTTPRGTKNAGAFVRYADIIADGIVERVAAAEKAALTSLLTSLTKPDPTALAEAIAAALPADLAKKLADELAQRLSA